MMWGSSSMIRMVFLGDGTAFTKEPNPAPE